MRTFFLIISIVSTLLSCRNETESAQANKPATETSSEVPPYDFTIVFASCADQERPQPLWGPINDLSPDLFVWGGDNIYADTEDMAKMQSDYDMVWSLPGYAELASNTVITGTWDDHDYGKNDAGVEYSKKQEAQKLLLDFLNVPEEDERRKREGVYTSETYETGQGSIKIILLDTRYFRDPLKRSEVKGRRYESWEEDHKGTMLGEEQWKWFEEELNNSDADFNLVVSSIQFLSKEHGWEKWYNFPSEVDKFYNLIQKASAKNIIVLSGDRHMAEISVNQDAGLSYPLVDFTSSGMTHTWIDGPTEANEYRVSNVVKQLNFGVLFFDFENKSVTFEIRGEEGFVYERFTQQY